MHYSYIIAVGMLLSSCGKIKDKSEETIGRATNVVSSKVEKIEDKIVRHFDPYEPDSKWNQTRFSEFFAMTANGNASQIYSYGDEIGIDHSYAFSFTARESIVDSIVTKLQLTKSSTPEVLMLDIPDFPWWPKKRIAASIPYYRKTAKETYEYLWYDNRTSKVYYLLFDL
jgi:hypothetical protein